ncbi:hypothetical protein Tco_1579118 [Tanacetum coccineum]
MIREQVVSVPNTSNVVANAANNGLGTSPEEIQSLLEKFLTDMSNLAHNSFGGEQFAPSKPKANFCSISSENLYDGVNFSIPRKVVEKVNTRFDNTLYGYFIGKRVAFPVVEYYVFFEDSISIIASQIINADDVFKDNLTIGVPLIEDSVFSIEMVRIEYKWKPPRCDLCKIFGHVHDQCPKKITVTPVVEKSNDGFQTVVNQKKKGKSRSNNGGRVSGQSVKPSVRYEPKAATTAPKTGATNVIKSSTSGSSHDPSILKSKQPKGNVLHASSSSNPNVRKGGTITVSNSYAA